jgi:hypothetical protein
MRIYLLFIAIGLIANSTPTATAKTHGCDNGGFRVPEPTAAEKKRANIAKISNVIVNGGSGSFRCAYKTQKANGKCQVTSRTEFVPRDAPEKIKQWYGAKGCLTTINIQWPSGKQSKFVWSDSLELMNFRGEKEVSGYWAGGAGGDVLIDWSRGFTIWKYGKNHENVELIRLW